MSIMTIFFMRLKTYFPNNSLSPSKYLPSIYKENAQKSFFHNISKEHICMLNQIGLGGDFEILLFSLNVIERQENWYGTKLLIFTSSFPLILFIFFESSS